MKELFSVVELLIEPCPASISKSHKIVGIPCDLVYILACSTHGGLLVPMVVSAHESLSQ